MKNNKSYIMKADMEVSDLISTGGYLQEEQANAFIVDMIKAAKVLPLITVQALKSHTKLMDKVGFATRVLRPGTSGVALSVDERSKPTTAQVTLNTKLIKGEIRLNSETLEDNIESGNFKNTVMAMTKEQVALDIDELVVNGDTTSTDDYLALFNGMLALSTTHVVNAGTVALAKSHLKSALKAMPKEYNRMKAQQQFLTADNVEIGYRDYLADRATVLGDKLAEGDMAISYGGRPINPIPTFPTNLGIGSNCSNVILTHPKNLVAGFWRKVKFETDYDVRSGEWILVPSLRLGVQWQEEDAVVKISNVLAT
jgi:hypothetical protein